MQKLKEENLSLQRERDWILESENIDPEDLEREPVCRLCGGSGWRGAAMCECLQELCRQEQKKVLLQSFGTGKESFEKFRLDVYPDRLDPKLGISPRALMKRVYESAVSYARDVFYRQRIASVHGRDGTRQDASFRLYCARGRRPGVFRVLRVGWKAVFRF